jgi:hypothetical protein
MSEPSDAETFRGGSESRVRTREGTVDVLGHEVARGIGLGMKKGLEGCTYVQYPAREEKPKNLPRRRVHQDPAFTDRECGGERVGGDRMGTL